MDAYESKNALVPTLLSISMNVLDDIWSTNDGAALGAKTLSIHQRTLRIATPAVSKSRVAGRFQREAHKLSVHINNIRSTSLTTPTLKGEKKEE